MKVKSEDIDYQIVRLVKQMNVCDLVDGEDMDKWRLYLVGFIDGLTALGDAIKEVIKN